MMHAVSTGMSLNDVLYIAVKSDVGRADEFYDTAVSLLPALPGWVSQAESDRQRYTKPVNLSGLGESPSIRRLARLYSRKIVELYRFRTGPGVVFTWSLRWTNWLI
ncbi:MAG: hypothetical protein MAG794_01313 [Gammaproteobacteria bacterium]|nr:hypothetical protein [Gammaproteobacteria bacterium]